MGRIIKKGFFWGQKGFLKLWSMVIGMFITLISGCRVGPTEVIAMYGIIIDEYKIKGKVTSLGSGEGISGISIETQFDTVVTDSNGMYEFESSFFGNQQQLRFTDIDSTNGVHALIDTLIDVSEDEQASGLKTFDITLDPIEQNENPE